ncbi:MAG: N-acetylmuramoyl-L-alanine amidase [Melioribacter sp.]|nr:N-acetylmuramoyl-L-alanine amidase [Melioribacter sp.]
MREKLFIFLLACLTFSSLYSQRQLKTSVKIGEKDYSISCINKNGVVFISAKELASILSLNCYFNSETKKIEIKFSNYSVKLTAESNFIVLLRKEDNYQKVYQIPLTPLLIQDDIFFPIAFTVGYLSIAYGSNMIYNQESNSLVITDESTLKTIKTKVENNFKYDLYQIYVEEKINGTLVRFKTSRKITLPRYSIINNILYVFFANATVNPEVTKGLLPLGLIRDYSLSIISEKNFQFEFFLAEEHSSIEIFQDSNTSDIILTIHNKVLSSRAKKINDVKDKWIFDAVVIDAGHGGEDPGAIGVTGVKEKDINLGIALKLGKLIEENLPTVRVIYTRKTDTFVELYKRGKIANENGGKLFISIHCNSTPQKNTNSRGFEVYLLRPGRTKEAIAIAEFENSVIKYEDNPERYQQLTDENFILVTMAHSQFMRYSEKFSDILNQEWEKMVEIPSNGIKQAGFYVLVGASMPSVLIETGYLSNKRDEEYLRSSKGQLEIAKAIFNAIKKFKEFYDKEVEVLNEKENKD